MFHFFTHKRPLTGLVRHSSLVALASIRALTSHLRRHYQRRYHGQYRLSRLVFGFDLILVGIALTLIIFDLGLLRAPRQTVESGLLLTISMPPLRASDAVPVEVSLRVTDAKAHTDVSLHWDLPEWVEILHARPALDQHNTLRWDSIQANQDRRAQLILRLRALPGTRVPFKFTLRQAGFWSWQRIFTGLEERQIMTAALTARPALEAAYLVQGASIPLRVVNRSSLIAPSVVLSLTSKEGASRARFVGASADADGQTILLGQLKPGEERITYLAGGGESSRARFTWQVQDGAHLVDEQSVVYDVTTSSMAWSPTAWQLELSRGQESVLKLQNLLGRSSRVFIDHAGLVDNVTTSFKISPNTREIQLPLRRAFQAAPAQRWNAVIADDTWSGGTLGPAWSGLISNEFPLQTVVRYYTETGDQLGLGPLPPSVGQETRYWVMWQIAPRDVGLSQVQLETRLPRGVRATGKFASEYGGKFSVDGSIVRWKALAEIPALGDKPALVSFEIGLLPPRDMAGKIVPLVATTTAQGLQITQPAARLHQQQDGGELQSNVAGETTALPSDRRASGKGIVH